MAWQIRLAEWVVAFAILGGAYFWVGHNAVEDYKDEQRIVQMVADKAQQDKYNKVSSDYETLKNTRQQNAQTITKVLEKVITRDVYRNVCLDDAGLSVLNQALTGRPDTGKPDAAVQTSK